MAQDQLRDVLRANAAFCVGSGIVLAVFAGPLETISGIDSIVLRVVGVGLVPWGIMIAWFAARRPIRPVEAAVVIAGDIAWVLGTVVVVTVASTAFTTAGLLIAVLLGAVVAAFAVLQLRALRAG